MSVTDRKGWLRGVDLNHRPLGYERNDSSQGLPVGACESTACISTVPAVSTQFLAVPAVSGSKSVANLGKQGKRPKIFRCSACGRMMSPGRAIVDGGVVRWTPNPHGSPRCPGSSLPAIATDEKILAEMNAPYARRIPGFHSITDPLDRRLAETAYRLNRDDGVDSGTVLAQLMRVCVMNQIQRENEAAFSFADGAGI